MQLVEGRSGCMLRRRTGRAERPLVRLIRLAMFFPVWCIVFVRLSGESFDRIPPGALAQLG